MLHSAEGGTPVLIKIDLVLTVLVKLLAEILFRLEKGGGSMLAFEGGIASESSLIGELKEGERLGQ